MSVVEPSCPSVTLHIWPTHTLTHHHSFVCMSHLFDFDWNLVMQMCHHSLTHSFIHSLAQAKYNKWGLVFAKSHTSSNNISSGNNNYTASSCGDSNMTLMTTTTAWELYTTTDFLREQAPNACCYFSLVNWVAGRVELLLLLLFTTTPSLKRNEKKNRIEL